MSIDLSKQTADFSTAIAQLFINIQSASTTESSEVTAARFELIGKVKIKIDEMMPEGEGVSLVVADASNVTDFLDVLINAFLDECAVFVHQTAPPYVITGSSATETPVANSDYSGYIPLPDDFIKLQSFKMSGWKREIAQKDLITPNDPKYILQCNSVTRGGKAKPVCVLNTKVISSEVVRVIDYYSLSEGDAHTVEKFLYIPLVAAEDVQSNLVDALTWVCAWKVLDVTNRNDEAKLAYLQVEMAYKNLI